MSEKLENFVLLGVMIMVAALIPALILSPLAVKRASDKMAKIEENHNEITFYLDGEEVEYENIDLSLYQYTFDEEENKVFLTKKQDVTYTNSTRMIPFFIFR